MADYISREALLSAAEGYDWVSGLKTVLKRIPAADVRPVVLCKNCKHRQHDEIFGESWCNGHRVPDDWFCADGAKREES